MKKYVVVLMGVLMAVVAFAGGMRDGAGCEMRGQEKGGFMIFEKIPKDAFLKAGVTEDNYNKAAALVKTGSVQIEKTKLAIAQRELEIKKYMIEDNKNWAEIEKLVNENGKAGAENRIKKMKLREETKKYITEDQMRSVMQSVKMNKKDRNNRFGNTNRMGMPDENKKNMMNNR